MDLLKYGIKLYTQTDGTFKVKCPECQPPHDKKDNPLSVTISNGNAVWFCHHCGHKGFENTNHVFRQERKRKIYERPKIQKSNEDGKFMYDFFAKRGITRSAVETLKLFTDNRWIGFPYFNEKSEIINVKYRSIDKSFKQVSNAEPILYNYDNIYQADTVIFCEGEIDVLSLIECGYTNVTTLPNGAPKEAKFDENDGRFKALQERQLKAKKIILFTDNDESGKALHKELLHRFGKDLCWYVDIPQGCKDANEILVKHGKEFLKNLVENAIPYPVSGLYSAHDYENQVQELYEGNYERPITTGINGLDDIYKLMTGTFHTITGIPNHGKSLFLDQIAVCLAEKEKWKFAIYSPEHSTQMHIRRLLQMITKKNFDEGLEDRMTKEELEKALDFINNHFYFIETKESVPSIDLILEIAKSAIFKFGVKGLILDPYNEISASRDSNKREDEHIRDFISLCKRFTRLHEILLWVVAHPTKLPKMSDGTYLPPSAYDISGASHWHNQADAVLTVHRDFDDNTTRVITRKIREQDLYGKIGEAKFKYNFATKRFESILDNTDDWSNINFND